MILDTCSRPRHLRASPKIFRHEPAAMASPARSLLLIDDDRRLLESMSGWLREQGYKVETAQGFQRAAAQLARKSYDLALIEVRLADGDGFDLLESCRQKYPQMSVLLMSSYATAESA